MARCRDRMIYRGPDGKGLWISPDRRVGLAHRRLSILDISEAGAQPMSNQGGTVRIVFNGEIYNFLDLRNQLLSQGAVFRSHSDTEVLLHLYERDGKDMLNKLRGMFAFAIWDSLKNEFFLARDPLGIKPLYFSDNGKTFIAASQVKALLTTGEVDTSPEPAGHVGFFLLSYVPEPFTLYKGIRSVPAGSWMRVNREGIKTGRYWNWSSVLDNAKFKNEEIDLHAVVRDSVRHHLVSDVPVGLFLSAGIDSNVLAANALSLKKDIRSLTLGFSEYHKTEYDEVPLAERSARLLGLNHTTVRIEKSDFQARINHFLDQMDQPTTDGLNTYMVGWAAIRAGMKVALSGLGGDELFGGYPSFHEVPRLAATLAWTRRFPWLAPVFKALTAPWVGNFTSPKYAGFLEYGSDFGGAYFLRRALYMPWELTAFLDPELVKQGVQDLDIPAAYNREIQSIQSPKAKVSALEATYYMRDQLLRDADWAGMAHSVEIRVPYVDQIVFETLAPSLASECPLSKKDLALCSPIKLPQEIVRRSKTGFYVPVNAWVSEIFGIKERGLRGWAKTLYANQAALK